MVETLPMAEQWMSIVEYARTFQVSDMTVRRRIKTGRLHAVLQEGKYFIPVPVDARGMPMAIPDLDGPAPVAPVGTSKASRQGSAMKSHPSAHKTHYVPTQTLQQPHMQVQQAMQAQHPMQPQQNRHQAPQQPQRQHVPHPQVVASPVMHHKPLLAYAPSSSPMIDAPDFDDGGDSTLIPGTLQRSLAGHETSLVDTRALLAYCEASLRKLGEMERRQAEKFKSRLETLETTVAGKDMELKQLRQQVEDLQLLVKFLDVKKKQA